MLPHRNTQRQHFGVMMANFCVAAYFTTHTTHTHTKKNLNMDKYALNIFEFINSDYMKAKTKLSHIVAYDASFPKKNKMLFQRQCFFSGLTKRI